ncbi:AAA family ATPase [Streptomyces zaomyceticus]|uniref:AAA family ATPase n=1 Tax=Streptomyces zaomyceticus TaxID=68286 RepID=UPI00343FC0EE
MTTGTATLLAPDLSPLRLWAGDVVRHALEQTDTDPGRRADMSPLERLYPSREDVLAALGAPPPAGSVGGVPPLPDHLAEPLRDHGFDDFDLVAVALALAPDLEPALGRAIARLRDDHDDPGSPYVSADVLVRVCGATGADREAVAVRLTSGAPLVRCGLLDVVSERPGGPCSLRTSVRASPGLLRWLFGVTRLPEEFDGVAETDPYCPPDPGDTAAAEVLTRRLGGAAPGVTHLYGPLAGACLDVAWWSADRAGLPVLRAAAAALANPVTVRRLAVEALLRRAVLLVDASADPVPPDGVWESFRHSVVVGDERSLPPAPTGPLSGAVCSMEVLPSVRPLLDESLRTALRLHGLDAEETAEPFGTAGARLTVCGHERRRIIETLAARGRAGAVPGGAPPRTTAAEVCEVAALVTARPLDRLATRLPAAYDWSCLVLPTPVVERLHDVRTHVAARDRVRELFRSSAGPAGLGKGASVLFAGPSGTGKTLAARLIAGELGYPLYRVDLASVVSKYIGETERNLEAVFTAAERTDAVLLFDEADALFGKRSEVQDARDRYANLEVAYLLQRMESYDGLAVLATNLLHHLDEAFSRRLSFIVHFPFPEAAERELIWRAVWPAGLPRTADVDLTALAERYPLSGGHIRNVVVTAAHLATAADRSVDHETVLRALEREYDKFGRMSAAPVARGEL